MKKLPLFALVALAIGLTGCRNTMPKSNIVKCTYMHKYGVPVAKGDWERQGRDGQIISLTNDGITECRTFSNGILHGETTTSFSNSSTVHFVEMFDMGSLTSRLENYFSGVPKRKELYANGEYKKVTGWYEDGTPSCLETYDDGLLVTGEYRTPLNVIESRVDRGEGTRISRLADGALLEKDTIQNGLMVQRITYFLNGDPASVISYENGLIHGLKRTYVQGGLPNTVEQWVHGVQEGVTSYYQNGEKVSETPFVRGERHGVEKRFLNGESVLQEITWTRGTRHGPTHVYTDSKTRTEWYHQGELVSRNTFERMNLR